MHPDTLASFLFHPDSLIHANELEELKFWDVKVNSGSEIRQTEILLRIISPAASKHRLYNTKLF